MHATFAVSNRHDDPLDDARLRSRRCACLPPSPLGDLRDCIFSQCFAFDRTVGRVPRRDVVWWKMPLGRATFRFASRRTPAAYGLLASFRNGREVDGAISRSCTRVRRRARQIAIATSSRCFGAAMATFESIQNPKLLPGTRVEVLNRSYDRWAPGFAVKTVEHDGYRLGRNSDGYVLPVVVERRRVRPRL